MVMEIELRNGQVALIDEMDWGLVGQYHPWRRMDGDRTSYAFCSERVNGKNKATFMHRLIMAAPSDKVVHHINQNGLDNRRENLEICDRRWHAAIAQGDMEGLEVLDDPSDAPDGVNIYLWDQAVQFAMSQEVVTARDMVEGMGITAMTAHKYLTLLAEVYPDVFDLGVAPRRGGRRGPPPRTLCVIAPF